jgi:rod shape-determining protein MreB
MFDSIFKLVSYDLGVDLGTTNTTIFVLGKGIAVREPTVIARNKKTKEIVAVGTEAKKMIGRTPGQLEAFQPLKEGVISDFEVTEQMLRYFIEKAQKKKFILNPRPRIIIGIPCGVTEVEKKAVIDAAKNAGAREVFLIEQPMAAAIGARLPVQEAGGNFIVDIGGGTTEVAVISLGGIVISKSLRIAGDRLNEDIMQFSEQEYKLLIGERTAEEIKIAIGSAIANKERKQMPLRGRNLVTGLPEEIMISSDAVRKAMEKSIKQIDRNEGDGEAEHEIVDEAHERLARTGSV